MPSSTSRAFDNVGVDSATDRKDPIAVLRRIRQMMDELEFEPSRGEMSGPAVELFDRALELLFGGEFRSAIEQNLEEITGKDERTLMREFNERHTPSAAESKATEVAEPGFAAMSLNRLYADGKCTRDERAQMSLLLKGAASEREQARSFIANRESIPAGAFSDAADDQLAVARDLLKRHAR